MPSPSSASSRFRRQRLGDLAHQVGDALVVFGGDGERVAQAQAVGFQRVGQAEAALGLVGHQQHAAVLAAQPVGEMLVGRGDADARVDDEDDQVGLANRRLAAGAHAAVDRLGVALLQPGGIDQADVAAAQHGFRVLAVAGDAWRVGDDGGAPAGQAVEEGGFADIRAAGDDDTGSTGNPEGARPKTGVRDRQCHGGPYL